LPHFVVRADASESIGGGHIMRCLALADQLLDDGGKTSFFLARCPEALQKRLADAGHTICLLPTDIEPGSESDAAWVSERSTGEDADCVVVDGYQFSESYQKLLKKTKARLLYIDDLANCSSYCADFILNQNPWATPAHYQNIEPQTKLLLGCQFILMRAQFLSYRMAQRPEHNYAQSPAKTITVTMGAGDINNISAMVMQALSLSPAGLELNINVIAGAANIHVPTLKSLAQTLNESSGHEFGIVTDIQDMAPILGASDLVISAGGTTIWEASCLGRPTMAIITADNQRTGMVEFAAQGAIKLLGEAEMLEAKSLTKDVTDFIMDNEARKNLGQRAASLIDGQGAKRVGQALKSDK